MLNNDYVFSMLFKIGGKITLIPLNNKCKSYN